LLISTLLAPPSLRYRAISAISPSDSRAPVPAGAVPAGAARDGRASVPAGAVPAGAAQSMGDAPHMKFFFL